jgi:hypothetical protein
MCVVSMIVDHYTEKWQDPQWFNPPFQQVPMTGGISQILIQPQISPEEIAEFRRLLERAREYDKRNSEPDCELESKKVALKKIAEHFGVEINFL